MHESQAERTLQLRVDAREQTHALQEELLRELDGQNPSENQTQQLTKYRSDLAYYDQEINTWSEQVDADREANKQSEKIRRAANAARGVADTDEDGIVYRTMAEYARDVILTGNGRTCGMIQARVGNHEELDRANERLQLLKRVPANTLTSDIAGLLPPQHISQIFQVIQTSRPIVESATRAPLNNGVLTYPQIDQSPIVAVQTTQKTEAGNQGMDISMVTATASTYLGGGDLSWQAINWSTPNALDLWFRLIAADYALKTEQDAAQVISHSAFTNNIASTLAATPTFAQLMTGIGAGGGEVYANSGRMADTLYVAPDRYWYAVGLTTDANLGFGQSGMLNVSGEQANLRVVVSRGLDSGVMIVGDSDALLVAETPGAPVELRVVEPAIGGVEVGLIGAFEAVVVDDGAFAMLTTAS